MGKRRIRRYRVTKEVDMIAPEWLVVRINEGSIKNCQDNRRWSGNIGGGEDRV